jgi:hypothetical protein
MYYLPWGDYFSKETALWAPVSCTLFKVMLERRPHGAQPLVQPREFILLIWFDLFFVSLHCNLHPQQCAIIPLVSYYISISKQIGIKYLTWPRLQNFLANYWFLWLIRKKVYQLFYLMTLFPLLVIHTIRFELRHAHDGFEGELLGTQLLRLIQSDS